MAEQHDRPPPRPPLDEAQAREVVATALERQDAAARVAEADARVRALGEAAAEVGLDPAYLPEAEAVVRVRAEERARREVAASRRRRALAVGALVVAGLGAVGLWVGRAPAPPEPWTDPMAPVGWALEQSPGTTASVAWPLDPVRGEVARVEVTGFAPMADGRYWVNLESGAHPDWAGATEVSFAARGEGLGAVRLYLETPTERWRGPVVPLGAEWSEHTLSLRDFERQERRDGEWSVVGWAPPERVDVVSFKLGHWVNGADATGTAWIDSLGAR